ncbi:MAG TPA: hypothetical protein VFT51_02950 [Bacillales bacterium]|nr:hypothetical protein [Bacillales bacterium]
MRAIIILSAFLFMVETNINSVDLNLLKNEIAFTFFDLSNGEAVLIQNRDENVLINTGSEDSRRELYDRLEMFNVHEIEKVILTNASEAYTGNLTEVIKKYHVHVVLSSKGIFKKLHRQTHLPEDMTKQWTIGKQDHVLPGLKAKVLYVTPEENDKTALVVRFQFGAEKILYMGLSGPAVEKELLDNPLIDCQILKVGDFGAGEGNSPEFLRKVDPQVAILFHKKNTSPTKELLEELNTVWIDVYRTHQTGTITVKFDLHSYRVITIPIEEGESV